jgi:2-octaprenylphenol hydroxylase
MAEYDIVIVGAGIVGATAALALAHTTSLRIALLDAREISAVWDAAQREQRVSAITLASQRIFQQLGVWEEIETRRISPYRHMLVWDAAGKGKIQFDSAALELSALGYIVEDQVVRAALLDALRNTSVTLLAPVSLLAYENKISHSEITTASQEIISAKLMIGADGGDSWIRTAAGIALSSHDYRHVAISAALTTSLPHGMTARQRFLTSGPLAFLPLADKNSCSIVWSTSPAHATELMALEDDAFRQAISAAFEYELGEVLTVSPRASFLLQRRHARHYVQARLALIGDAAHTIHPLAGQGVNLGLLDAVSLVETITTAIAKNRDYASYNTLRRYERWRKTDNLAMQTFVGAIKQLFSQEAGVVQSMRNSGLNLVDKSQFIKNFFAAYAAGNRRDLPAMARTQTS